MNIAVDIDDTLTNTSEYFQPFVAEYFGVSLSELRERGISYDNLPAEWSARYPDFCRQHFDRLVPDMPFKEDAEWGLQTLHEMGHRIVIVTARTKDYYEDPEKTTRKELQRGGVFFDALYCTPDKLGVCRKEKIDLLIDDTLYNLNSVRAANVRGLMMESFVNASVKTDFPRVTDWHEAVRYIREMEEERTIFQDISAAGTGGMRCGRFDQDVSGAVEK